MDLLVYYVSTSYTQTIRRGNHFVSIKNSQNNYKEKGTSVCLIAGKGLVLYKALNRYFAI